MIYLDAYLTEEDIREGTERNAGQSTENPENLKNAENPGNTESHAPLYLKKGKSAVLEEEDVHIRFHLIPARWLNRPEKLRARLERMNRTERMNRAERMNHIDRMNRNHAPSLRWMSPSVRAAAAAGMPEREPQTASFALAALILRSRPPCEHLTIVLPCFGEAEWEEELGTEAACVEEIVGGSYGMLNSLLLVSSAVEDRQRFFAGEKIPYYHRIYQDSGLLVQCAGAFQGGGQQKNFLCVNLRCGWEVPVRDLPRGAAYLDMTSDPKAQRLLAARRKDISYTSALNYLDTYLRKRYNTLRYKRNHKFDNG